tara:strand:+ start:3096 stop:3908 length:813 start_codon:yes stop_codon:yes gene_type:complete
MKESQLLELLDGGIEAAYKASQEVLNIYNSEEASFESKKDGSPVTLADLASHEILNKDLSILDKRIPVLSEEGNNKALVNQSPFWLIDPLDGTKEFINRNGEFTVNIALIEEGSPIMGIVFAPALDQNFYGAIDIGAFKLEQSERIEISPIRQSNKECYVTLSKSHKSQEDEIFIGKCKEIFEAVHEIPAGSSLKLCRVAEGKANIYSRLGPTFQWDIAAGQAVVESAGGVVKSLSGTPLTYKFDPELRNPKFYCSGDDTYPWEDFFISS